MQFSTYNPSPLPPQAVVLNYCLCSICHEPYLLDSSGSPICGRLNCYLMQRAAHPRAIQAMVNQSEWWEWAKQFERKERIRRQELYESTTDLMKNKTRGRGRGRKYGEAPQ